MSLSEFLQASGITQAVMASRLGVHPALVCRWISGARRPGRTNSLKIERATKGAVPATAWDKPTRRRKSA